MIEIDDNATEKNPRDFYLGAKVVASEYGQYSIPGVIKSVFFDNKDEVQYVVEADEGVTLFQNTPAPFVVVTIDKLEVR